jgi:hypothetical protein
LDKTAENGDNAPYEAEDGDPDIWADFLKHPVRRDVQEGVGKQEHLPGSALEAFVGTHSREQIVLRGIDVEVCLDSENRRVG